MAGYSVMISSYLPTPITCSIQSAVQRALCHFRMWYWQVHHPDHSLRKAFSVPSFRRAVGRQLPAFSCFRACLSCRESFQPRSCPSQGSLPPVMDCGEDRRAQPFLSYSSRTLWWAYAPEFAQSLHEALSGLHHIPFLPLPDLVSSPLPTPC